MTAMATVSSSITGYSLKELHKQVILCLKANRMPMIWGSPAIGKSSLVHQIATEFRLQVIDMRLSQCEPTDLLGFPQIDKESGRAFYAPMDTFPLVGDPLPEGKQGWLLFLDELSSANRSVQAAAYKLILDRMVGQHRLHPKVVIVGAGNQAEDGAIVEDMSTALGSRMIHFTAVLNQKNWLEWAMQKGIDHRVISYINYRPDSLYMFDPASFDKTYPAPRTWEMVHDLITANDRVLDRSIEPAIAGAITPGVAAEFLIFNDIYKDLVTVEEILRGPEQARVPFEPMALFALTGTLSHHMNPDNAPSLFTYLKRLPIEFQVITLRQALVRQPALKANPEVQQWIVTNANELF